MAEYAVIWKVTWRPAVQPASNKQKFCLLASLTRLRESCDGMAREESLCIEKLAKSYREVEQLLNLWKETDCHSIGLIQSLKSPLEQLHSCEKANFSSSPLGDFENLKQKLQYKLLKQTECVMTKLQQDL